MDYTSIHIYGHLLSDDILHSIERDNNFEGNRVGDFGIDTSVTAAIGYAWSSLRSAYNYYKERSTLNDPYGTRRSRDLMERLLGDLGYSLQRQATNVATDTGSFAITYLADNLAGFPIKVEGDLTGDANIDTLDKCSLDFRAKGERRQKSPHAIMLEYLNSTENIYGIVANGRTLRLIRNSGQLVKLTYIEFDIRRMVEEDKYSEFCLMFRLLHASRFVKHGDEQPIMERYFNLSIESGNRIRDGLSQAVQRAMEIIGTALVAGNGEGNDCLRQAIADGSYSAADLNKELIHFIYRLLFLFIIEDRNLVYQLPDSDSPEYAEQVRYQDIYKKYYAASRFRGLSELNYLRDGRYSDLWESLMDTFRLFEAGGTGHRLGIEPLGGVLFGEDTLRHLKQCTVSNDAMLRAFDALNVFTDERGNLVKINYSSLDVEEFGSVYEGILEMRPFVQQAAADAPWQFSYVGGLDRKSTSSYYTRPDLVQSLIRTTLIPVIEERIKAAPTPEEKVASLLSMKVCDPASGSGHFALAMARTIAWYVCSIRTGEDNPASLDFRQALREVIQKCIYAVDYNPDAVELCKVVLWIEGYCAGQPLSFLDHHIRCGNSVVGVADIDVLMQGVPKEAFNIDGKEAKKSLVKLNKEAIDEIQSILAGNNEGGWAVSLFDQDIHLESVEQEMANLAFEFTEVSALPETSMEERTAKKQAWAELMSSPRVECLRRSCDIYTYAFYKQFQPDEVVVDEAGHPPMNIPYSRTVYQALQEIKYIDKPTDNTLLDIRLPEPFKTEVAEASASHRFFHWAVEFPDVFADGGGFDVMCGNPPWDKIKVEDKKWFEQAGRADIVNAGTAAQRKAAIKNLPQTDPALFTAYQQALQNAEAMSRYVRFGGRFPLTATGDIDLYPMFAELCMTFSRQAWGLVLPTGIAVNDSNKAFFSRLVDENRLKSLYDFENREALFDIHRMFKFCLLTAGAQQDKSREVSGGFYLTRMDHLLDPKRIYTLRTSDFALLNPNTKTCPVFRTSRDAALTTKIYRNSQVLVNEVTGENPWKVKFARMLDMSNDSHLFRTYQQLTAMGATLSGNRFTAPDGTLYVPLYEGKMIWHYNHHYGTWPTTGDRPNTIDTPPLDELQDTSSSFMPWYWVPQNAVEDRLVKYDNEGKVIWKWKSKWLFIYRSIGRGVDVRTFISTTIPHTDGFAVGVGNSATVAFSDRGTMPASLLASMMTSLVFDFAVRQKLGGINMSTFFVKQFPVLTPEQIPGRWQREIVKRVAELTYFNHDLDGWAEELWDELDEELRAELPRLGERRPRIFDPERRAVLQAELDAIFAQLYGLTTEELRYILDPEDVCGPGCINETFRVLKDNETRLYGEYRTRRLVLDAWHRFNFHN